MSFQQADNEPHLPPTPSGPFFTAMRFYWPEIEALDGSRKQPTWRVVWSNFEKVRSSKHFITQVEARSYCRALYASAIVQSMKFSLLQKLLKSPEEIANSISAS